MASQSEARPLLSVVVPFLDEEGSLPVFYERLTAEAATWGGDYEVIAVDDGSKDSTLALLKDIRARDPRWRIISFSRNFGHQTAVSAGLHYASGAGVVTMDADLQDPPEIISSLIEKWKQGYQVVYAVRQRRKEAWCLRAAYWLFYRILRCVAFIDIPLDAGDFCLIDAAVADVIRGMPERNRFLRGMRSWAGFRQAAVEYDRPARAAGKPKYTLGRLFRLAIDGLVSFSFAPLRIASWIGLIVSAASMAIIVFLVVNYFHPLNLFGFNVSDIPGRPSLVCAILFVGGTQLLCLGVMGEYLGRVFEEAKHRPPWVIAHAWGLAPPDDRARGGWFAPGDRS